MRCVDVMIMLLRKGIVRNDETQTQNILYKYTEYINVYYKNFYSK